MEVSALVTTGSFLMIGLFFGFSHIIKLREWSLKKRKNSAKLDKDYKDVEKSTYRYLYLALIGFMVNVILFGFYVYSVEPIQNDTIFIRTTLEVLSILFYVFFVVGSVSSLFFIHFLKKLSQMIG